MNTEWTLAQMAGMMSEMLPSDTEPTNPVAQFLSDEFNTIFEGNEMIKPLKAKVVEIANEDPNRVLTGLVRIHNNIGTFVEGLYEEAEPPEKQIMECMAEAEGDDPDTE